MPNGEADKGLIPADVPVRAHAGPAEKEPLHGFQGDRVPLPPAAFRPAALTICISREAGSRGGSISRRVGRKLGWQVYTQEMLEYISQEGVLRENVAAILPPAAARWMDDNLHRLQTRQEPDQHHSFAHVARTILALGATGEVVLIGRGAGCILPRETTLNVRVVAPLEERIAYMGQWLRLSREEAAEQVRVRDRRRAEFLASHFNRQPGDVYQYDLVLNSSFLGEDLCVELIAQAAKGRLPQPAGAR